MKKNICQPEKSSGRKVLGKCILYSVWAIIVFAFFYFFIGGALANDLLAWRIERKYASMELPDGMECVETASFVGNTAGTGNLTEIWAGMLVYSELPKEELDEYFEDDTVWEVPADLEEMYPYQKDYIDFTALNGENPGKGYFVVSSFYNAFTQMDLRGH